MFDRLEIRVLPPGPRWGAQLRFRVNGEEVVAGATGVGGRGPLVADVLLSAGGPSPLRGTGEGGRVELGEPECTGGCCGFLSVVVQRVGDTVQWTDWQVPHLAAAPPEFRFEARRYDAELARVEGDQGGRGHPPAVTPPAP
ncbi:hypothetical protein QQM39_29460 [Streptomyces sp. DT2A-34]|uniref:hypothetical protein n=1 Tax=Streptomyces sp. DT2A-34 TaxID=3051182 RepID=UPI00265C34DF|nr:hypothetical protein [Streptomyces sp. DT2A-34]MDO0914809.1 hypothetical protein [Streptomyces sp. DT2A-34]